MLVSYFFYTIYTVSLLTHLPMLSIGKGMYVFTESKIRVLVEVVLFLVLYICLVCAIKGVFLLLETMNWPVPRRWVWNYSIACEKGRDYMDSVSNFVKQSEWGCMGCRCCKEGRVREARTVQVKGRDWIDHDRRHKKTLVKRGHDEQVNEQLDW